MVTFYPDHAFKTYLKIKTSTAAKNARCLGPVSIAASAEGMLLAHVIRQAVEDVGFTEESLAHCKQRRRARRYIRAQADAVRFFRTGFQDFLDWYDVGHIFHAETILRGVRRIYGEAI